MSTPPPPQHALLLDAIASAREASRTPSGRDLAGLERLCAAERHRLSQVLLTMCAAGAIATGLGAHARDGTGGAAAPRSEAVRFAPAYVASAGAEPDAVPDPAFGSSTAAGDAPAGGADPDPSGSSAAAPAGTTTDGSDEQTTIADPPVPAADPDASQAPAAAAPAPQPPAPQPGPAQPAAVPVAPLAAPPALGRFPASRDATASTETCGSASDGTPARPAGAGDVAELTEIPAPGLVRATPTARCAPPVPASTAGRTASGEPRGSIANDDPAPVAPRDDGGAPALSDPSTSLALPGAVPVGVPNFFIDKFRLPVFLLPIYQAAGIQYGVRWEVLAAINEIETDYGRNLNVSSAGALGWMQFMPATWQAYGVDANRDGRKDPFNPVDAIFAAARYLKAAGADDDLRKAIFAYNHADWYVESILMRARLIGGLPSDLVGSLSGLTQGHFPVFAKARYAGDRAGFTATRRSIDIFAKAGSPAIAVQDGRITATGHSERLGNYVRLRDAYGNTYTYAQLKRVATHVPVPKLKTQTRASIARELALPVPDAEPTRAATAGRPTNNPALRGAPDPIISADLIGPVKERLFAHPARPRALANGGATQLFESEVDLGSGQTLKSYFTGLYGLDSKDVALKRLAPGRRVVAGTILGRVGRTASRTRAPHLRFEIRPAGRGAPRIDPKPILDGWKLLESTAVYRAQGTNALLGGDGGASIGQIMLLSKQSLARRVLANPRIEIYSCGRRDIAAGLVDRRVLATLEFLAASGLKPTISSLQCAHGRYTASANVSEHASGNAVDISKINGIPIRDHQGEGSIADIAIRRLLVLQGTVKPHQIISLMSYDGADNTFALSDHADHIHVGFRPDGVAGAATGGLPQALLKPSQWLRLIDRLGRIDNPTVSVTPSKYAIRVAASPAPRRGP